MEKFKYLFAAIFVCLGLFLAFLGRKLWYMTVFIIGDLAVTAALVLIGFPTIADQYSAAWVGWAIIVVSLAIGTLGGILATKLQKPIVGILCAWGGFCLGVLVNNSVVYLAGNDILFWSINILLAVVCGVAGYKIFDMAIIIATSFIGSYLIARGASLIWGGFPNAYLLMKEIKYGLRDSVGTEFYYYLIGMFAMTVFASYCQRKMLPPKPKDNYDPDATPLNQPYYKEAYNQVNYSGNYAANSMV